MYASILLTILGNSTYKHEAARKGIVSVCFFCREYPVQNANTIIDSQTSELLLEVEEKKTDSDQPSRKTKGVKYVE